MHSIMQSEDNICSPLLGFHCRRVRQTIGENPNSWSTLKGINVTVHLPFLLFSFRCCSSEITDDLDISISHVRVLV